MNGGADLGGIQGYGKVVPEPGLPDYDIENYHADWEPRVMAMVVALGACGQWNIDQSRFARENISPAEYVTSPYYKIWANGVTKLLLERDMVTKEELVDGEFSLPPVDHNGPLKKEAVWEALHSLSGAADRPTETKPAFSIGDRVTTIHEHPETHTRLPRYARGKQGTITKIQGYHVFPDRASKGEKAADWLYQVRFDAQELWGDHANANDSVTLDLWQPYFAT